MMECEKEGRPSDQIRRDGRARRTGGRRARQLGADGRAGMLFSGEGKREVD